MGEISVLVVDDQPTVRDVLAALLDSLGYGYRLASDGAEALALVEQEQALEVVLTDVKMPGLSGIELLQQIRQRDPTLQVVMISRARDLPTVRDCLRHGAHDYLAKPFDWADVEAVVARAIAQTRLLRENRRYRLHLEEIVAEQTQQIRHTRDIALLTLAKLAESRDQETGRHLDRISAFSDRLAAALRDSIYAEQLDDAFCERLGRSSALHDIGKVGIPDAILLKSGSLSEEEVQVMQRHTTIGGDTLRTVIEQTEHHDFLQMAMDIAYSHHERWDGDGYPLGLEGEEIPLSGRIVAIVDAYDAITSTRPYKLAFSHDEAVRRIAEDRGRHFDPLLVDVFLANHREFDRIRCSLTGKPGGERLESPQGVGDPSRATF